MPLNIDVHPVLLEARDAADELAAALDSTALLAYRPKAVVLWKLLDRITRDYAADSLHRSFLAIADADTAFELAFTLLVKIDKDPARNPDPAYELAARVYTILSGYRRATLDEDAALLDASGPAPDAA